MRKRKVIYRAGFILILLMVYVLLCNTENTQAVSKAEKAKILYAKYLQSACSKQLFCLLDINQDKIPELLTAGSESEPVGVFRCVYTFAKKNIVNL